MKYLALILIAAISAMPALAGDANSSTTTAPEKPALVGFSVSDEKASAATDQVVKQSGARILMEKTADVKITASVSDVSVEEALSVICKAGELEWRRIFIPADSMLLKNPDTLAATLRLMEGLRFPEMIIEKTSTREQLVHASNRRAVDAIPTSLRKDMGMVAFYVVTNDRAAKRAKEKADSTIEKYSQLQRESMEMFMKMTPEEREQALAAGMVMMQQMDPSFMLEATKAMMKMGPEMMNQIQEQQMKGFMSMPPEDRRAMMRVQMNFQRNIPPEMMQMLQEDAIAVMKELRMEAGQPPQ